MKDALQTPLSVKMEQGRLELLHQMIRIRRFEEKCAELYTSQNIRGFLHLYIGEEAVAVGAIRALTPQDAIVATYREHGHALTRGVSANAIMAEMFGKPELIERFSAEDCIGCWAGTEPDE